LAQTIQPHAHHRWREPQHRVTFYDRNAELTLRDDPRSYSKDKTQSPRLATPVNSQEPQRRDESLVPLTPPPGCFSLTADSNNE
jgi:hypothetical protein